MDILKTRQQIRDGLEQIGVKADIDLVTIADMFANHTNSHLIESIAEAAMKLERVVIFEGGRTDVERLALAQHLGMLVALYLGKE